MTSLNSTYEKPFFTIPEQIRRLRERGMDCGTDAYASEILERYGYYRLSGYWHPFRKRPAPPDPLFDASGLEIRLDSFVDGANLAHVVALYDFDHQLRSRLSNVLSTIEIAFRFYIGHRLGKADRFAHRSPTTLDGIIETEGKPFLLAWKDTLQQVSHSHAKPKGTYSKWLEEYDRHEKRAKDSFVSHFRNKYGPHLPIWVATEVMSFGLLSKLYNLMPQIDQEIIAARFQVNTADGKGDRGSLANWLNNLRNVRNICAHYGRIWNRTFDVLINTPGASRKNTQDYLHCLTDSRVNNKLYGVLVIMRYLLCSVAPGRSDLIDIVEFIESQANNIEFDIKQLGFPDDWRMAPIWKRDFSLNRAPMVTASLLDRTESLTAVETRAALTAAEVDKSDEPRTAKQELGAKQAAQRKLLNTYRHYEVLIEINHGGAKYYPAFQFRDGKIIDALAETNKELNSRGIACPQEQLAAALLDWWETPRSNFAKPSDGPDQSPLDLLSSVAEADFLQLISDTDATESFAI